MAEEDSFKILIFSFDWCFLPEVNEDERLL